MAKFSTRHGFQGADAEITITRDAPEDLRAVLVDIAYEAGLTPHTMRDTVCRVLRVREDRGNWSPFPNVDSEVRRHLDSCEWFEVYDVIEATYSHLLEHVEPPQYSEQAQLRPAHFKEEMNSFLRRRGIGWQLVNLELQVRGAEGFQAAVASATSTLNTAERATAVRELQEALHDLSKRPDPDLTGAIQHAMAALECVMREACGDPSGTLGSLIARFKGTIPPPLDQAIEKMWGFASERGRHIREGQKLDQAEVALIVHTAAAVASYLTTKTPL